MKVTTSKSVVKLLHKINTERFVGVAASDNGCGWLTSLHRFLFTMMRPPAYAQSELLSRAQKKQRKHHTAASSTDGGELAGQDIDKLAAASPHVKKNKMAKNYLKQEDKQFTMSEHVEPSEYLGDRHHSGQ